MGQTALKDPRRIYSQPGGGGSDPTVLTRLTYLENNVTKFTYFESVATATGTITKPTGSTIQLDQLAGGADAYVSTIVNGQPTGIFPQTAGGAFVDVASFDALGNYTLTGTPSAFPVAIIYVATIKAVDWQNVNEMYVLDKEDINAVKKVASTDNAISRFDGTTGQIQNSLVTINDSGAISVPGEASPTYTAKTFKYDTTLNQWIFYDNDSSTALNVGYETWFLCVNNTGSTITNGSVVYINGASGGVHQIALAKADSASTAVGIGIATEDIANGATGKVTQSGLVNGVNTSGLTAGAVYASSTVAGGLTNVSPSSPNYRMRVGFVGVISSTVGTILVTPSTAALGNGLIGQAVVINAAGNQEFKTIMTIGKSIAINNKQYQ